MRLSLNPIAIIAAPIVLTLIHYIQWLLDHAAPSSRYPGDISAVTVTFGVAALATYLSLRFTMSSKALSLRRGSSPSKAAFGGSITSATLFFLFYFFATGLIQAWSRELDGLAIVGYGVLYLAYVTIAGYFIKPNSGHGSERTLMPTTKSRAGKLGD